MGGASFFMDSNLENATSLVIGGETKVVGLAVGGKLYVFQPIQMQFLLNLQKMKNITAASLSVGKDEMWGTKFLHSRKFNDYLKSKLEEYSVKTGLTAEYLIRWGKEAMEGKREWYEGVCVCGYQNMFNTYEYSEGQDDDLESHMQCKRCYGPVAVERKEEPFEPSREQMEAYKELKSTVIPRVERVHHAFENVHIAFESEEI